MLSAGFLYFEKIAEALARLLLLANRYVLIALLLIGPIVINITLYHLLMDPRNWSIAMVNLVLYSLLLWYYRRHLFPLFRAKIGGGS